MNINNFLISTHTFNKNENLEKFRFKLLNSMMIVSIFFAFIHFILITFGLLSQNFYFQMALFFYSLFGVGILFLLRQNKLYYRLVVYFFVINSLLIFFFTLVIHPEDEFRLIAFFLASFSVFVLLGKKYGMGVSVFIFVLVLLFNHFFDLELSSIAIFTFSTFFIIFSLFLYMFLHKIEQDDLEFHRLYQHEVEFRKEQEHLLLHQSRLASMGEMIDSIAHQWKQPLMSINKSTEIDEVASLTLCMSHTIDDFRELLNDNRLIEVFDVHEAIKQTLELLVVQLNDVQIHYHKENDILYTGHYSEFMQMLMLLLNNAIEVLAERNIRNKEITIEIEKNENKIILTIEDNAGGIKKSDLDQVFNAYFSTKKEQKGRGLGLYIAQLIVKSNNLNSLEVTNTKKGAKFIVTCYP